MGIVCPTLPTNNSRALKDQHRLIVYSGLVQWVVASSSHPNQVLASRAALTLVIEFSAPDAQS